ncbi:MAG: fimbria/pilus periplasmic chaperone [Acinetobacter sp.]|uniref:fimbrial biogenesis chaperone n=1 Tax=Acinetobacter sp. TaxID=472 RepID=UPI0026E0BA71|nr:fimbria/pilus periplasmic chaperone [Acinetobacter sp.]MDO5543171.1 fimbria/pilus periplasmic chaperone [Acinetobacter sp.]
MWKLKNILCAVYVCAYVLLQALISVTHAGSFGVTPTGISLDILNNKSIIAVNNHGHQKAIIQAEVFSWIQSDGQNQYMPTQEVWVEPKLLTIFPGKSQYIRVGTTQREPITQEKAYRLLLTELPSAITEPSDIENQPQHINVLLRLNLPVYITPITQIRLQQWQAQHNNNGTISIKMKNVGNSHILINEISILADTEYVMNKTYKVVQPHQSQTWEITQQPNISEDSIKIKVKTDIGEQNLLLKISPDHLKKN